MGQGGISSLRGRIGKRQFQEGARGSYLNRSAIHTSAIWAAASPREAS
jgi:hypothetical protein